MPDRKSLERFRKDKRAENALSKLKGELQNISGVALSGHARAVTRRTRSARA